MKLADTVNAAVPAATIGAVRPTVAAVPADLREPDSFWAALSPSVMPFQLTPFRLLFTSLTPFSTLLVSSMASMTTEPSMLTSLHA